MTVSQSFAQQINIYLKPATADKHVQQQISRVNEALEKQGIFDRYVLRPFLDTHPLHITLYLSHYRPGTVDIIKQKVAEIAKHHYGLVISSRKIWLSPSLYLMLDVDKAVADYAALQQLSDEITKQLSPLHDSEALAPRWIKSNKVKQEYYRRYGSPNVFAEFAPHFTLLAANIDDPRRKNLFRKQVQSVLDHQSLHLEPQLMDSIGIGVVSEHGQIGEEIASYPLQK